MSFAAIPVRSNGQSITYAWFNALRTAGLTIETQDSIVNTATSGGTLTLLATDSRNQRLTGTSDHSVKLPDATTMAVGAYFRILNASTGIITIKYNDATTLATIAPGASRLVMVADISTSNGVWWADPGAVVAAGALITERLDVASAASITQLSSAQSFVKLTGTTATTIHGIEAAYNGQEITLYNGTTQTATIKHASGTATAADRFALPNNADLSVSAGASAIFKYDTGQSRWILAATCGGSAGGGGGSIQWIEDTDAPESVILANRRYYKFGYGISQYLYASVRVPSSYIAGSPIKMRVRGFARSSTNTILLQSVATLNRTGTDAITSTTNQRTSTNAAVANVVDTPQSFLLDISATDGTINSVAIAAGDEILVRLQLGTGTNTNDVYAEALSAEVTFNA